MFRRAVRILDARCDRCGDPAKVRVLLRTTEGMLDFCEDHYDAHVRALVDQRAILLAD